MGNNVPRGKLSYIILSTLANGDKYGYEIITEIEKLTNGAVIIKQPSLYSSLKRMEDQDLISSYWMDSDIGGRRHYYRLTDYGKKQLEQWKTEYDLNDLPKNEDNSPAPTPTFLQQENLFDIQPNNTTKEMEEPKKPFEDDAVLLKNDSFIQYNLFDQPAGITQPNFEDHPPAHMVKVENTTIEQNNSVEEKREEKSTDYDIFAELDLFKNSSRSFSGSMSKATKKEDYHNNTLEGFMGESFAMQQLDTSFITTSIDQSEKELNESISPTLETQPIKLDTLVQTPVYEDAKFITDRIDEKDAPQVKKIAPAKIDVFSSTKVEFNPKATPVSYDEKIGELYNKVNNNEEVMTPLTISNYTNLKKYFDEQKISFTTYAKSDENKTTQTSLVSDFKFSLIRYSLTLLSIILSLTICFVSIKNLSYIPSGALAIYIVPPILYAFTILFILLNKAKNKDRKVLLMETNKIGLIIKISAFIVISLLVYAFNLAGGLNTSNFNDYTNTMIVPFILALQIPLTSLYSYITTKFKWIK